MLPCYKAGMWQISVSWKILFFVVLAYSCSSAHAVTFPEQSERLQLINVHLLDYRPNDAPMVVSESQWEAALDLMPMPNINNRVGNKVEKIDSPSLVPRPRLRYLTNGLMFGGSLTPPVELNGVTALFVNAEAGVRWGEPFTVGGRVFVSSGRVNAPITSADTKDDFSFSRSGLDLAVGYGLNAMRPYVGAGTGQVSTQLDVSLDGATLKIENHSYVYGFAGISYDQEGWSVNFEQNQTETFLRHFIVSVALIF